MDFNNVIGVALRSAIGPEAGALCLAAIGLNVHYAYTGLLNFGQVGFMLVGAYGLGIAVATWGWSMWLGIGVGLAAAAALALFLGLPTLRLRSDYFAITTIAVAEMLRLVIRSGPATEVTGGPFGLQDLAGPFYDLNPIPVGDYGFWELRFNHSRLWVLLVTWGLVALSTLVVAMAMRSPWGRVLRSIREDEDAARSLGKNVFSYKMQSLLVGGLIGGVAGIMFALRTSSANAEAYEPQITFFAYAILILGGAATRFGPILGTLLFWAIFTGFDALLREAARENLLPGFLDSPDAIGAFRFIVVGLGIILVLVFRPQGVLGNRDEIRLEA